MEKDEYYEEKQIGLKTYYRLHPAFDWRELSNKELTKKINKLQAELKRCDGKPVSDEPLNATCNMHGVMGSILSVSNGWGEESTFYKVGGYYETVKIAKIQQETKVLGAGYYNDLTINCYVGYSSDGKKLFEINDGANVEVRYCP